MVMWPRPSDMQHSSNPEFLHYPRWMVTQQAKATGAFSAHTWIAEGWCFRLASSLWPGSCPMRFRAGEEPVLETRFVGRGSA